MSVARQPGKAITSIHPAMSLLSSQGGDAREERSFAVEGVSLALGSEVF